MENEIWEAAELIEEWEAEDRFGAILRYKSFYIPREAIDENSDETGACLVIGIDNGGVRRVEELIDSAYGRFTAADKMFINDLLAGSVPDETKKILESYL